MQFDTPFGTITLLNEPTYSFGSADNTRQYACEKLLDATLKPTSIHGVLLDERPLVVFGDAGGCSGIHKHSLAFFKDATYMAVGRHVVKFALHPFCLAWSLQVDEATCFGVHVNAERKALLSHGELAISRFSEEAEILWSATGADVFSEGFSLHTDHLEVIDFNHHVYRFNYERGEAIPEMRHA